MGIRGNSVVVAAILAVVGAGLVPGTVPGAHGQAHITFYASPHGDGNACNKAAPCDVVTAVATATDQSAVILEPGDYGSPSNPLNQGIESTFDESSETYRSISVQGQPGKPVPTIYSSADFGLALHHSSIKRVSIDYSGSGVAAYLDVTDGSHLHVVGTGDRACGIFDATLSDSVCRDTAANGHAVDTGSSETDMNNTTLLNVTAVADGSGGNAVYCAANKGSTSDLRLVNTIAVSDGFPLAADASDDAVITVSGTRDIVGTDSLTTENDGFASLSISHRIKSDPTFVDRAAGDYHELAGSNSVDAGTSAGIGKTDLDGLPRKLGKKPDIGAYELPVAATIGKAKVSHHSPTSITVEASVNTEGLPAEARLEADHGNTAVKSRKKKLPANGGRGTISLKVKHLSAGTHYSFTIIVNDVGGTTKEAVSTQS